jgi:hypothetical protein
VIVNFVDDDFGFPNPPLAPSMGAGRMIPGSAPTPDPSDSQRPDNTKLPNPMDDARFAGLSLLGSMIPVGRARPVLNAVSVAMAHWPRPLPDRNEWQLCKQCRRFTSEVLAAIGKMA